MGLHRIVILDLGRCTNNVFVLEKRLGLSRLPESLSWLEYVQETAHRVPLDTMAGRLILQRRYNRRTHFRLMS